MPAAHATRRRSRPAARAAAVPRRHRTRSFRFRDRDRICCHDISVTQCYALETLVDHGPVRVGALARRLFLDKSTTSRVVATLARKGYVEQQPDASDGRATALNATRRGRALCARINADLVAQQRALLEDFDPKVRAGVIDVIRRLAGAADARFRTGVSVGEACCAPSACSSQPPRKVPAVS